MASVKFIVTDKRVKYLFTAVRMSDVKLCTCTNCRCMQMICCVCATENVDRTDLSHPIHSDNCIIQPDNTCKREAPAYTSRDYRLSSE